MFTWLNLVILTSLSLFDLYLLLILSKGVGIPIIAITQVAGAVFGFWRVKNLDFNLFFYLDAQIRKGEVVIRELWEEAMVLTGSCLLIVPGFFSDIIAIFFLFSQFRALLLDYIYGN